MPPPSTLITSPDVALSAVCDCDTDLVLDFDHTLYLDNSTERWLDSLRPSTLALIVVLMVDTLLRILGRLRLCEVPRWRDQACVAVTLLLFPWSRAAWRRNAATHMAAMLNPALADATRAATKAREVTVLSYGFEQIIAPLLAHAPFPTRLIASDAFSHDRNMRLHGKRAALEAALDAKRVRAAVFVTDSRKDQDVLDVAGTPALVQWAPYTPPAFDGVYLPMRYATVGKYAGRRYFTTQILQEDLAIWLLAYAWSPTTLPILLLLFLAMYCIYEIGYWENDHIAAKNETAPNLSETVARFAAYPIIWAWPWAAGLLVSAYLFQHRLDAAALAPWAWASVYSVPLTLLALFATFKVFNRITVKARRFIFPFLHLVKNFAGVLILPLTPLGALLLLCQVISQVVLYFIHRGPGGAAAFHRHAFRAVIFVALLSIGLLLRPKDTLGMLYGPGVAGGALGGLQGMQAALIFGWLLFRSLQRSYGRGLLRFFRGRLV